MTLKLSPQEAARGRTTLSRLVSLYPVERGNWEVDCPEMVERVLAMAAGDLPLAGRFAAVAFDRTYTFIHVVASEVDALALLVVWVQDHEFPKRPVALADLLTGSIHALKVTVDRGSTISTEGGSQ